MKTGAIFQSTRSAVCKLKIVVFEMYRTFKNSKFVLKEAEKQPQHLKIARRRNYFSDHLLMQIKTQIRTIRKKYSMDASLLKLRILCL